MKRISILLCLFIFCYAAPAWGNEKGTEVFKISVDGKKKEVVATFEEMVHPHISPKGNYFYMEKMKHQLPIPESYAAYSMKTKKWLPLSSPASWYPKSELLAGTEKKAMFSIDPSVGRKTILYTAPEGKEIDSFLIAPDERYATILQFNVKTKEQELVLLDMKTLKHRINDRFLPSSDAREKMSWLPNGKKVFYKTSAAIKELDLPTGLKYVHKIKQLPLYSADLQYRFVQEEPWKSYIVNLKTGKKQVYGNGSPEKYLEQLYWAPKGHAFVGLIQGPTSNAQDIYQDFFYSDGNHDVELPGLFRFLKTIDNIHFSGWSSDQKWLYFADLESVHFMRYWKNESP